MAGLASNQTQNLSDAHKGDNRQNRILASVALLASQHQGLLSPGFWDALLEEHDYSQNILLSQLKEFALHYEGGTYRFFRYLVGRPDISNFTRDKLAFIKSMDDALAAANSRERPPKEEVYYEMLIDAPEFQGYTLVSKLFMGFVADTMHTEKASLATLRNENNRVHSGAEKIKAYLGKISIAEHLRGKHRFKDSRKRFKKPKNVWIDRFKPLEAYWEAVRNAYLDGPPVSRLARHLAVIDNVTKRYFNG